MTHEPPQTAAPHSEPQPGSQPAYPQQWAPATRRPPLAPRHRTGALVAGGVGLPLVAFGIGAVVFAAVVGFIALLFGLIARGSAGEGPFGGFVETVSVWIVAGVIAVALIIGAAFVLGGVLGQRAILRRYGVHRPTAVTWSSLGVGVVANVVVGAVVRTPLSMMERLVSYGGSEPAPQVLPIAGAGILVIAVAVAVGALTTWWMAHVFRAADPAVASGAPAAR